MLRKLEPTTKEYLCNLEKLLFKIQRVRRKKGQFPQ
jgi:hypothetical protein